MLATAVRPSKILPRSVWGRVIAQIRATLARLPEEHLSRALRLVQVSEGLSDIVTYPGFSREHKMGALQAVVGICANRVSGTGRPGDRQKRRIAEVRRVLDIIERA